MVSMPQNSLTSCCWRPHPHPQQRCRKRNQQACRKSQLLLHLHAPLVKAVPMFEDCDDAFIKAIVLQLRPQVLLGGDAAFKAGEEYTLQVCGTALSCFGTK